MDEEIASYNRQNSEYTAVCDALAAIINEELNDAHSKIWHKHPAWFLDDNPIVGYSVEKQGVRLRFWSGKSFNELELLGTSRFKDASIFYTNVAMINKDNVRRWLAKSKDIQWDYKNIVKRKGKLLPLKGVNS